VDAAVKRGVDIIIAVLTLVVSVPLMALLVGPRLLRGRGIGLEKEEVLGARKPIVLTNLKYPSWAGRAHLSRLPNLWLVLAGRMSFVGPRPMPVSQAQGQEDLVSVLEGVRPGFIGPWWLVGRGRPMQLEQELAYDLHYLRNYSIWLDVHILIQVVRHFVGLAVHPAPLTTTRHRAGLLTRDMGELTLRNQGAPGESP
jgi:lipopolysaccharide/colanic/teichoic acid biosynthesis glycosyltransferase